MTTFDFKGKTALVTGASGGIGAEIARQLAAAGAVVAVHCASNRTAAEALVQAFQAGGGRAFVVQADLRDVAALPGLVQAALDGFVAQGAHAKLDILVNNAGAGQSMPIKAMTPAQFDEVSDLLFRSVFFMSQLAMPHLVDGGRIVNISSNAAGSAQPYDAAYGAAKAAVNHLTLSFAQQLGPRGITVNAIAPGATDTPLLAGLRARQGFDENVKRLTALGRMGEPKDIAGATLLLLAPEAGWITGQVIEASGGMRL